MGQWSELAEDLVINIEERLVLYVDKVRFRAVCKPWNCIPPKIPSPQTKQLHWLFHKVYNHEEATHGLFNPLDKKVYLLNLPVLVDEQKDLLGSSNGWVVAADKQAYHASPTVYLLNPLTQYTIEIKGLDRLEGSEDDYLCEQPFKTVLSSSPLKDDCMLVAMYEDYLAYGKCKDKKWTSISFRVHDIIFHKRKLYALGENCSLYIADNDNLKELKQVAWMPQPKANFWNGYMVEPPRWAPAESDLVESLDGELMLIALKSYTEGANGLFYQTDSCNVFKLDPTSSKWSRMKCIGEQVIFVGNYGSSISVSCLDFPGLVKGNRVVHLTGVFNIHNETVEPFSGFLPDELLHFWHSAFWFTPSCL